MPQPNAANNVVPFSNQPGTAQRRQEVPAKFQELLDACRDKLAHGIATAFAEDLTRVQDNLLKLAERTNSLERQHLCFATQRFLTAHGQELLEQFRGSFVRIFDEAMTIGGNASAERRRQEQEGLSLVDETAFERELTISKLTSRAAYNCSNQLTPLNRRMAVLMQVSQVGQDDNPLYPQFIFDAMLDASRALGADEYVELPLLQQFELYTSTRLPNVYKSINQFLIDNDILPKIPLSNEYGAGDGARSTGHGVTPPGTAADTSQSAADGAQIFAQLIDRLRGNAAFPSPSGAPRYPATFAGAIGQPGFADQETHPISQAQLVGTLTDLQRGSLDAASLLGVDPDGFDPGMAHVLQKIRSTPQVSQSHPMDVLTLDIVALLFDVIFKDPDFPIALRAEISKLQIPMLKVALTDKSFFANKLHPARKLLDLMAGAAVGWNDDEQPRLIDEIRDIIETLITSFDKDIGVFAKQVERLETFLDAEEQQAARTADAIAKEMEKRDRREFAQKTADTEIQRRLHSRTLPDEIADFLSDTWRLVLIRNLLSGGTDTEQWTETLRTIDDLIWSVTPKRDSDERVQLMTILPDLLERLRAGLESVSLEADWQPFFSTLIRLHMETLHADPNAEPSSDDDDPVALNSSPAPTGTEAAETMDADPTPPTDDELDGANATDRYMALAKGLEVGAWVEFRTKRGKQSLRLSWVSRMRGVYLFTNRQGMNALSVAVTRLADHLRKGAARVHRPTELTERAVTRLLGKQPSN